MKKKMAIAMAEPALIVKQAAPVYEAKKPCNDDTIATQAIKQSSSSMTKIRLLYFFFRFSTGSLIPFIPLFMQHCGFNNEEIGTLQAIRPIMTMISAPLWGGLADRTGKKKLILMMTFLMSSICRLSVLFFKDDIRRFAFVLCSTSVFYSAVSSLLDSIVVSSLNATERLNFGKLRLWGELGNGISSFLMMRVANSEVYGFEYLFIVHGITAAVAVVFMLSCTPSSQCSQKDDIIDITTAKKDNTLNNNNNRIEDWTRNALKNAELISIFGIVAMTGSSMALLENFCYINMKAIYKEHGQEERAGKEISTFRVFYTTGGVMTWWYSGSWQKRLGPNRVIVASASLVPLCLFCYAGIGTGLDIWTKLGFVVAEACRSAIFAALWSAATIRVSLICPPQLTAVVQTAMEASYRGIGHCFGAYVGGVLCKKFGIANTFNLLAKCLVSLLCALGALLFSGSQLKIEGSNAPK